MTPCQGLPVAAGIGLRAPHLRHVDATRPQVPWFEVHSENYFADGGPVLLALGIGTRVSAIALFVFNIVAVISYPDLSDASIKDHMLWGALLLVTLVYGPGKFALDRWFERRNP